jgi:hypothetical protein
MRLLAPNKSPEPTAVGVVCFAFAFPSKGGGG